MRCEHCHDHLRLKEVFNIPIDHHNAPHGRFALVALWEVLAHRAIARAGTEELARRPPDPWTLVLPFPWVLHLLLLYLFLLHHLFHLLHLLLLSSLTLALVLLLAADLPLAADVAIAASPGAVAAAACPAVAVAAAAAVAVLCVARLLFGQEMILLEDPQQ